MGWRNVEVKSTLVIRVFDGFCIGITTEASQSNDGIRYVTQSVSEVVLEARVNIR